MQNWVDNRSFGNQALVVQRWDGAIQRDKSLSLDWSPSDGPSDKYEQNPSSHPLDGDLFHGWCYAPFEQLRPGARWQNLVMSEHACQTNNAIHLIPKWRPINYSFVCVLISPLCLACVKHKRILK